MKTNIRAALAPYIVPILAFQIAVPGAWAAPQGAVAAPRAVVAKAAKPVADPSAMVRILRAEVQKNPAFYYDEADLSAREATANKVAALEGVQALIARLKDSSYSMASIREDLIHQAQAEEEAQLVELEAVIRKMPEQTLEAHFRAALDRGIYPAALRQDFEQAYTVRERQDVVLAAARADLSIIRSATIKRLGAMSREGLLHEMNLTRSVINTKDKDSWKVVLVVVIGVAAAGFIGWSIMSSSKKRWEKKEQDMQRDQDDRIAQARTDHERRQQELIERFRERERLREEGYVWQVCGTTTTNKSVSCSYDFSTRTGAETCVTRCLKHPTTGAEAQAATTCTSAFIPNNCLVKNPYRAGYDDGYDSGYDEGFDTGYDRAYREAYSQYYDSGYDAGYNDGYDAGWYSGYDEGYDAGFSDGLSDAQMDSSYAASAASGDSKAAGLASGYQEGYAYALTLRVGS